MAVLVGMIFASSAALAQPEVIRCLPPEVPTTDLPDEVLVEYRAEIEAYFVAVSDHITCLDEERTRAMDEARAATEAYTHLINTIPAKKDLP